MQRRLKWRFISAIANPFRSFLIFSHRKKNASEIPDHPVCHSSSGDLCAILFPVLFLTVVWKTITTSGTLPRRCSAKPFHKAYGLCHLFLLMTGAILVCCGFHSSYYSIHTFSVCGTKTGSADKLFPDFFQWSTTGRAEFLFLRKFQILFLNRNSLNRSASISSFLSFCCFSGKWQRSSAFTASGFCSVPLREKVSFGLEYRWFFFAGGAKQFWRRSISSFRLSRSWVRDSSVYWRHRRLPEVFLSSF